MQEPDYNSAISTMVEIDPDPRAEGDPSPRRDLVLGLLLILVVLCWAGWQWWHQQDIERHYGIAQQAAERKDWDAAREHYAAAAEYKDASARAGEAANLIRTRDEQYEAALAHTRNEQWAASLQSIETVRDIQPGYRNIDSMRAEAEKQVYRSALSCTIALRSQGKPAGLYWRVADSWVWLEGSDKWSNVLGSGPSPGARIIYDAPTNGWVPDAMVPRHDPLDVLSTMLPTAGSPELMGRRLMAASLVNDRVTTSPLPLDPADHNFYLSTDTGVWGLRYNAMAVLDRDRDAQYYTSNSAGNLSNFDLVYQPFDGSAASTLEMPSRNWSILDIAFTGDAALLAEFNRRHEPSSATSSLYVAHAQGSRRLLYSHRGGFVDARLSPDGQHVLLRANGRSADSSGIESLAIVIDIDGNVAPHELPRKRKGEVADEPFSLVGATFLSTGDYAGKVLAAYSSSWASMVSIYDPASPQAPITSWEFIGRLPRGATIVGMDGSTGLLIAWPSSLSANRRWPAAKPPPGTRNENSLIVIKLSPGKPLVRASVPLAKREGLWDVRVRGDDLIYTTYSGVPRTTATRLFTTQALPLSSLGAAQIQASIRRLQDTEVAYHMEFPFQMPWSIGREMMAYTDSASGQLHARTYDGGVELSLEPGMDALYSSPPYERADWIR